MQKKPENTSKILNFKDIILGSFLSISWHWGWSSLARRLEWAKWARGVTLKLKNKYNEN